MTKTTIGALLVSTESYPAGSTLFLPMDEEWTPQTDCVIGDIDALDDAESGIEIDGRLFEYALGMDAVQSVVANARAQRPDLTDEMLFAAFLHYYDHDAFLG